MSEPIKVGHERPVDRMAARILNGGHDSIVEIDKPEDVLALRIVSLMVSSGLCVSNRNEAVRKIAAMFRNELKEMNLQFGSKDPTEVKSAQLRLELERVRLHAAREARQYTKEREEAKRKSTESFNQAWVEACYSLLDRDTLRSLRELVDEWMGIRLRNDNDRKTA